MAKKKKINFKRLFLFVVCAYAAVRLVCGFSDILTLNEQKALLDAKMEEALKRHASKKEIEEIFEEQMKEWGQKGNAEILKKLREILEEVKEKAGK